MQSKDKEVDEQLNCPTRLDLQKINEALAAQLSSEKRLREKAETICQNLTDGNLLLQKRIKQLWATVAMLALVVILFAINFNWGA